MVEHLVGGVEMRLHARAQPPRSVSRAWARSASISAFCSGLSGMANLSPCGCGHYILGEPGRTHIRDMTVRHARPGLTRAHAGSSGVMRARCVCSSGSPPSPCLSDRLASLRPLARSPPRTAALPAGAGAGARRLGLGRWRRIPAAARRARRRADPSGRRPQALLAAAGAPVRHRWSTNGRGPHQPGGHRRLDEITDAAALAALTARLRANRRTPGRPATALGTAMVVGARLARRTGRMLEAHARYLRRRHVQHRPAPAGPRRHLPELRGYHRSTRWRSGRRRWRHAGRRASRPRGHISKR